MTANRRSGYDLFGNRQFRQLWTANLVVTLGLTMLTLGASWAMTSLTTSAVLVSMVQTVMSLPFVLFAIPFGLASDSVGHRRMLLASQFWMLAVTALMGVIALAGGWDFTPVLLLSTLFLVGAGVVAQQAAWKPFLQDTVPPDRLLAAISLNSLSNRISQALGPIVGGYLMGVFGTAVVLFTRALSHLVMIVTVLRSTKSSATKSGGPARRSLREGWSALRGSRQLYGPLIRTALLMGPCSGVVALLPLEAKENIQTGSIGFGGLLAALGFGTAFGVTLMPVVQRHLRLNPVSGVAVGIFALATIGISQWDSMALDATFLLFFGLGWGVLSVAHQFAIQTAAPAQIRGLMASFYSLVLQGAMAVGSLAFGFLAQKIGVSGSILAAGLIALSGLPLVGVYGIPDAREADSAR